ncbi:hypothetical protein ASE80_02485 [Pseudomonas sp. Leaf15]|nr:hypothetical protein ASE80_02485 [Pseudomonas sp. Leaf15]
MSFDKSGDRRGRRLIGKDWLTGFGGLLWPIFVRLTRDAARICRVGHQGPGQNTNLVGFKPGEFGADSRVDLHKVLLKRGSARFARAEAVHPIESLHAD